MEQLRGTHKLDVAIAGGGMSGLTIALWLSRAGLRVALLEGRTIGSGASCRCCGAVLSVKSAQKDERLIRTSENAVQAIRELAEPHGLWQDTTLFRLQSNSNVEEIRNAVAAIIQPSRYLELLMHLAQQNGVTVYERSRVTAMETNEFHTEQGTLRAPYLVIATGYPILSIPGWYFLRLEQREYDVAYLQGGEAPGICLVNHDTLLIPTRSGMLLRCCAGRTSQRGNEKRAKQALGEVIRKTGMQMNGEWQISHDVHTPDGLPVIGPYSSKTPALLIASGYGGQGIVGSMLAAQSISSHVLGLPSTGYEIYAPERLNADWNTPIQTGWRYAKNLLAHVRAPKCPHMGCRLVYNPRTKLWECPCHGSCFDDIGRLQNAPAVYDAVLRSRNK